MEFQHSTYFVIRLLGNSYIWQTNTPMLKACLEPEDKERR